MNREELRKLSILKSHDRLRIFKILSKKPLKFHELMPLMKMKDYELSFHLAMMVDYGLLSDIGGGFSATESMKNIMGRLK